MTRRILFSGIVFSSLGIFLCCAAKAAEEGQLVNINGEQYRETVQKQQRQVVELEERTREFVQTRYKPVVQKMTRSVMVPITEYSYQAVPVSSWNPFGQQNYEWRQVPVTRWEQRNQEYEVTTMVPEQYKAQVVEKLPVTKIVPVEVKTRVAVNASPSAAPGQANHNTAIAVLRDPNRAGLSSTAGAPNSSPIPTAGGSAPWQRGGVSLDDGNRNSATLNPTDSTAAREALPRGNGIR